MTLIFAAIIVSSAILYHAHLNERSVLEMQNRQQASQQTIQSRQQRHEMEFAENQAKMFRENRMDQQKKAPKTPL